MKTTTTFALPVLLLAAAASWSGLVPAAEDETRSAAPAPAAYQIDPSHSWVLFKVGHLGIGTAWGSFADFSGSFEFDAEQLGSSSVALELNAASVTTNNKKRDDHLRGPDFFNAKEYPTVSFRSTAVAGKADGFQVEGVLELLGKEQPVSAELRLVGEGKDPWGNYRAGFEGSFVIDRTAFGMDYMTEGIGTEVTVTLAFEGTRR